MQKMYKKFQNVYINFYKKIITHIITKSKIFLQNNPHFVDNFKILQNTLNSGQKWGYPQSYPHFSTKITKIVDNFVDKYKFSYILLKTGDV